MLAVAAREARRENRGDALLPLIAQVRVVKDEVLQINVGYLAYRSAIKLKKKAKKRWKAYKKKQEEKREKKRKDSIKDKQSAGDEPSSRRSSRRASTSEESRD